MRTASLNISTVVINAMLGFLLVAAALVATPAHAGGSGSANQVPYNMQVPGNPVPGCPDNMVCPRADDAYVAAPAYAGGSTGTYTVQVQPGPTRPTIDPYRRLPNQTVTVVVEDPACPQRVNCLKGDPAAKARAARQAAQNALNRK